KACRHETRPFFETAFLARFGWKIFAGEQVWPRGHERARLLMVAPARAPAQHHSIQPPNTPAISGAIFGKTTGKNALENGSRRSVGSVIEMAPAGHWFGWSRELRHRRRTIQAIRGKLMAKRRMVGVERAGFSRC